MVVGCKHYAMVSYHNRFSSTTIFLENRFFSKRCRNVARIEVLPKKKRYLILQAFSCCVFCKRICLRLSQFQNLKASFWSWSLSMTKYWMHTFSFFLMTNFPFLFLWESSSTYLWITECPTQQSWNKSGNKSIVWNGKEKIFGGIWTQQELWNNLPCKTSFRKVKCWLLDIWVSDTPLNLF